MAHIWFCKHPTSTSSIQPLPTACHHVHINSLMQKRHNALEWHLFDTVNTLWWKAILCQLLMWHWVLSMAHQSALWWCYNAVKFFQYPHKKQPIACPLVWGMGVFCGFKLCLSRCNDQSSVKFSQTVLWQHLTVYHNAQNIAMQCNKQTSHPAVGLPYTEK